MNRREFIDQLSDYQLQLLHTGAYWNKIQELFEKRLKISQDNQHDNRKTIMHSELRRLLLSGIWHRSLTEKCECFGET
jgi:hypothetical protein